MRRRPTSRNGASVPAVRPGLWLEAGRAAGGPSRLRRAAAAPGRVPSARAGRATAPAPPAVPPATIRRPGKPPATGHGSPVPTNTSARRQPTRRGQGPHLAPPPGAGRIELHLKPRSSVTPAARPTCRRARLRAKLTVREKSASRNLRADGIRFRRLPAGRTGLQTRHQPAAHILRDPERFTRREVADSGASGSGSGTPARFTAPTSRRPPRPPGADTKVRTRCGGPIASRRRPGRH